MHNKHTKMGSNQTKLEEIPKEIPKENQKEIIEKFYDNNIFYTMTDEEYSELRGCKKYIGKYSTRDIIIPIRITKQNERVSVPIDRHTKAFNDIRFVISLDNNSTTKLNIWDIIKSIEIVIGGRSYDKLSGYAIDVLLKKQNKSHTQFDNMVIIPIPFDTTSEENLIFFELFGGHDVRVNIEFGTKCVGKSNLIAKYYDYKNISCPSANLLKYTPQLMNPNINCKFMNIIKQIQLCKESHILSNELLDISQILCFNNVTTDIFFMFIDDETGDIIKEQMFDDCVLYMGEDNKQINSFISLKHKSKENNCDDGVYWLSLDGIQTLNNREYQKYPNLSRVDTTMLCLKGKPKLLNKNISKFTILVHAVSLNYVTYWSTGKNSGTVEMMYSN